MQKEWALSYQLMTAFCLRVSTTKYKKYHSVCPLVGIGTLSPASVPLPPRTGGGGAHSPAGEGLGESQFRRREKSLALCLRCGFNYYSMYVHLHIQLGGHPCVAGLLAADSVCHPVHYHSVQLFQLGSTIFFGQQVSLFTSNGI